MDDKKLVCKADYEAARAKGECTHIAVLHVQMVVGGGFFYGCVHFLKLSVHILNGGD